LVHVGEYDKNESKSSFAELRICYLNKSPPRHEKFEKFNDPSFKVKVQLTNLGPIWNMIRGAKKPDDFELSRSSKNRRHSIRNGGRKWSGQILRGCPNCFANKKRSSLVQTPTSDAHAKVSYNLTLRTNSLRFE